MEAILDAAMRIIVREGLDGLTIARLAAELDIAVGGMYRYFSGKDALLVALQRRAIRALQGHIEGRMADAPPLSALVKSALAYADFSEVEPARASLIDAIISAPQPLLPDDAAAGVVEVAEPILTTLAAAFDRAVSAGELSPGSSLDRTLALWSCLHGARQFAKFARLGLRPDDLSEQVTRSLLVGWGADPNRVDAHLLEAR